MPLTRMEPALVEERDKSLKKKKKTDIDMGKGIQKITDHFKTPEKELSVSVGTKQKSLLQFFTKTASSPANKAETEGDLPDKENSYTGNNVVFPRWTTGGENKSDLSTQKAEQTAEIGSDKAHSSVDNNCDDTSDSVILLSDTSINTPDISMSNKDNTNKKKTEKGKKLKTSLSKQFTDKSADKNADQALKNELDCKDDQQDLKTDSITLEEDVAVDNKKDVEDDVVQCDSDPSKHLADTEASKDLKKAKKNALKGSEMMNLLKEIKKKEKKKKHKHRDKKQEEDKSEPHDTEDVKKDEENKSDQVEGKEKTLDGPESTMKDHKSKKSLRARKLKAIETFETTEVNTENETNKIYCDKDKAAKKKKINGQITSVDQDIASDSNECAEIKKVETDQDKTEECKENSNVKEMSYSEYLQSLESGGDSSNNDQSDEETFTKLIHEADSKSNMEVDVESTDCDKSAPQGIAQIFNFKTSTPNKAQAKQKSTDTKAKEKPASKDVKKSQTPKDNKTIASKSKDKKKPSDSSNSDCDIVISDEPKLVKKSSVSDKKSVFPEKTKQATLSFGSSGLVMSKQTVDKQEKIVTENKEVKKPQLKKRGRKKKTEAIPVEPKTDDLESSVSVFVTPKRGRKRKVEEKDNTAIVDESLDSLESSDCQKRRSTRKKYQITAFQMDNSQKTPIKLKLKRCKQKSSSSGDDELAYLQEMQKQVKMKLSKAQALLEKARKNQKKSKLKSKKPAKAEKVKKEKKQKDKQDKTLLDSARRSSRLEGKCQPSMEEVSLDNIVISSDDDHDIDKPIVKKRGRPKRSPNKATVQTIKDSKKMEKETPKKMSLGTPKKTPKKASGTPKKTISPKKGAKLAPLFMMGKSKAVTQSPIKPKLDPEQARQRQQFLMSGVPEELKKQTATRIASIIEADYPPIPTHNHVQQIPSDTSSCKSWSLNSVNLKLRGYTLPDRILPVSKFSQSVRNNKDQLSLDRFDTFRGHQKLEDAVVTDCLGEISSFNPSYPVQKIYQALKHNLSLLTNPPVNTGMKTDMSGILEPTVTEVITIEEEEKPAPKKRGRPSLKLKKKEEKKPVDPEPCKVEESSGKTSSAGHCVLWTDKYCPTKSSEVLGNGSVLKKLKSWLTEWKQALDREARKARKLLMKKNKGKTVSKTASSPDDMWDDDSDFDLDSDDSEDDMSLCNTMLLLGPNGCGKTCSVYALAQELGFKVHEVNASSNRSGRHILSQLQEATQSHQVASTQGTNTPSKKTAFVPEKPPSKKMTTAFNNFFKTTKLETVVSGKEKKRKRNLSNEGGSPDKKRQRKSLEKKKLLTMEENSQGLMQGLNLTSTTMILFDEVDVFFEEDKGFLSAIQTFMSTTKIPIILTTSDPGFTEMFDGRYEQIAFRSPPVRSIVSRLQTVALLENLRVDVTKLSELVRFYHGDMRKCLLSLQYVLDTGGSDRVEYRVIQKLDTSAVKPTLPVIMEDSQDCSQDSSSFNPSQNSTSDTKDKGDFNEDDDDFVIHKPTFNSRKKRILEDDSSNSVDAFYDMFLQRQASLKSGCSDNDEEAKKCPAVHMIGLEVCDRAYSCGKLSPQDMLLNLFKGVCRDTEPVIEVCSSLRRATGNTILHTNLPLLTPLTLKIVDNLTVWSGNKSSSQKTVPPKRSRILNNDLYDSEASNDATDLEKTEDCVKDEDKNDRTESKEENLCLSQMLSSFASYYDTMSSLDVLETSKSSQLMDPLQGYSGRELRGRLYSGMETTLPQVQTGCSVDLDEVLECSTEIEVRTACRMYREVERVQAEVEKLCDNNPAFSEQFVLPVTKANSTFSLTDTAATRSAEARRAGDNVLDSLPLVVHKQQRHLHLDYMPTLRHMCRLEQCRQITNTKRRFQHYFDSVNLSLRDRTIGVLSTTFL